MKNIKFNNVYINNSFTLISSKANNPSILNDVDLSIEDYFLNKKTFEEGEVEYQTLVTRGLLDKIHKKPEDIDLMIGGDLQNQLFASNYNASKYEIPFLGVFSACASFIEAIIIGASLIGKNKLRNAMIVTSSNNLVSEKQFRFPVEYGALRKKVNSFSASGAVSAIISNKKSNIRVESANIGKVIDMGHTDTNDMGACMAPAVAETLYDHLKSTGRNINYYDVILTGDLGIYGVEYLKEYLNKKYKIKSNKIMDAGVMLYNVDKESAFAGGSGPICAPLILFTKIIKKYKKILVLGSGSLHSCMSSNLKKSMLGISHAVSLEVID